MFSSDIAAIIAGRDNRRVSDADMDVIRRQYEAVNARDWALAMSLYAEDVVLVVPRAEGVHNPGTYEGREAVGGWFGDWFRMFDRDYRFEIEELEEHGDLIFLATTHSGRGRVSGVEVTGANGYLYTVEDGEITRVEFFATPADALAALPD
jgi:ketosteroid isomerase-like protein